MKLDTPEKKQAFVRFIFGFFYCVYRGILHIARIKPYDEE